MEASFIPDECPLQVANNSHDRIRLLFSIRFLHFKQAPRILPGLSFKDNFMGFVQRNARVTR